MTERRVRFLADFDYKPTRSTTIAYRAGMEAFVRKKCAERAMALGKAEPIKLARPPAGIAATIQRQRSRKKTNG